ncbi:MAG TPA: M28 family peptidase [Methylomirabilota bacterium]|nr:M28 family peptidase [Methylomirabilota bacterium]
MTSRRARRAPALSAAAAVLVAAAAAAAEERPLAITAADLRAHTVVLGSDAMAGRAPGSAGGKRAADYLARQLRAAGLRPLPGNLGLEQPVPLHGSLASPESTLELVSLGEARRLELGRDYLLASAGSQTLIPRRVPMVFVGYGIVAPEFDYNDYQGFDVRGRVVVYLDGEPPSDDPDFFKGPEPTVYAAPETKKRIALSRGAVGSLLVPLPRPDLEAAWNRTRRDYGFETLSLAYALPEHLSAILHPEVAAWLFADALYDLEAVLAMAASGTLRGFYLPTEASFRGRFRVRDVVAPNLVGVVPGIDPELRGRYVVLLAHYDHLGVGPPVAGDAIYNGVVDNALGVSCVVEAARQLASVRPGPRRSVIVLLTTAEEAGLLGARYFLDHSPVPPARLAAAVNVDGLAFLSPFNDLVGIGGELSDLGEHLRRAVAPLGLGVSGPPDGVWDHVAYSRGDQLAFAEDGVPSILVNEGFDWPGRSHDEALEAALTWMVERYHSPADDLDQPLDFEAATLHCTAVLRLVLEVANADTEPRWRPGVPYAYERLLSEADGR